MPLFNLQSEYRPCGDQPQAIKQILAGLKNGEKHQTLLGVTGSGKTFTMAHVIAQYDKPALIIAPNKTLAAQLYSEFKVLFPENAVEYFVSYYDYYQPEAYVPRTDTFIEKDSAINDDIDKMRHSATRSLLERNDVIIVASVSCIYGLGSPEAYHGMLVDLKKGMNVTRNDIINKLVEIQYDRNDIDFHRGTFRVRGDVVDIFPPYEDDRAIHMEFFGDEIELITLIDPLKGTTIKKLDRVAIYPGSHFVTPKSQLERATKAIRAELEERIRYYKETGKPLEEQRITQRTNYDLEMIEEIGFCKGIENYSRHLTGKKVGEPPPTLIEYFPKDFLLIVDESHITVSQIGAMYEGDRSRKSTLVEYGFRLPSALDNRPLKFTEFENNVHQAVYVSATPGPYELEHSGKNIAEQIVRPTGLLDPPVEIRPVGTQVDDLTEEIAKVLPKGLRVLVTTLTKRMAENLTNYFQERGIRVKYLHSDVDTLDRIEILREFRLGQFDVLIGINLLREGLDLPEVGLVAILDADKEGFLRSVRSLIQTFGRAARNVNGRVICYADRMTDSLKKAIGETERRRTLQSAYNQKNNITPQSITKEIRQSLMPVSEADYFDIPLEAPTHKGDVPLAEIPQLIKNLTKQMKKSAESRDFENAAKLRDEIKKLRCIELAAGVS